MNIVVATIGKCHRQEWDTILVNEYLKRMSWKVQLKHHPHEQSREIESQALLRLCRSRYIFAVDASGQQMTSKAFAEHLDKLQLYTNLAFAIGGIEGHDQALLNQANFVLSLSKMTLPHRLAKVMLIEQLYRAYAILHNHPYDR